MKRYTLANGIEVCVGNYIKCLIGGNEIGHVVGFQIYRETIFAEVSWDGESPRPFRLSRRTAGECDRQFEIFNLKP